MNRTDFHKYFKTPGPVVLPVIHVIDIQQTLNNISLAIGEGAAGVFLINHDFSVDDFLPIIEAARQRYPSLWLAVNFLAVTGRDAFPVLGRLQQSGFTIDAYWGDDARIDETRLASDQPEADGINESRRMAGWNGLYFGGTAFKKQREVNRADYKTAARIAAAYMDVITTSGIATGREADLDKITAFRDAIGDRPLALASGITPDNAHHYAENVDAFMVATGINRDNDFYNIDREKLAKLIKITHRTGA